MKAFLFGDQCSENHMNGFIVAVISIMTENDILRFPEEKARIVAPLRTEQIFFVNGDYRVFLKGSVFLRLFGYNATFSIKQPGSIIKIGHFSFAVVDDAPQLPL